MILSPLAPAAPGGRFLSAWDVISEIQKRDYESCWMITQPSHAALAADIAAKLGGPRVPKLDAPLIRAIALHDAGWGMPDAQAVQASRAGHGFKPKSFLHMAVSDFLAAWTQSIEIAQPVAPAGGYMVSRHFWRLAEHRLASAADNENDRKKLQEFLSAESLRQKKLAGKQERSTEELDALTDLLQFCDLLSLYLCCGAQENVEFPEYFGVKPKLSAEAGSYRMEPALIASGTEFSVAALRHPPTKEISSREIRIKIL